jgi:hypothetical protein
VEAVQASRGRTQTLIATTVAAGIVQLPTAAIVVALPIIHGEFQTSIAELQWTVIAFHLPFSSLLIAAGRLADIFGRRRLLIAGSALFAAGSAIAARSRARSSSIGPTATPAFHPGWEWRGRPCTWKSCSASSRCWQRQPAGFSATRGTEPRGVVFVDSAHRVLAPGAYLLSAISARRRPNADLVGAHV